jgi:hypothetical protein
MSNENTPVAKKRGGALIVVFAVLAVLIAGIGGMVVGVFAERLYQSTTKRAPDTRLIGTWVSESGSIQFHEDGTWDAVNLYGIGNGTYTGQYRWVDRETIDVGPWGRWELVFKDDKLTVKFSGGLVLRLTRKEQPSPGGKTSVE